MLDNIKIFSGNANRPLAEQIAKAYGIALGQTEHKKFQDGEIWVKYNENVRGADVFLVQPTNSPADNLMELLIMVDAAKRASAERITAVIPYFGYARQDRKDQPRVSITAKLVANLLTTAGADRVLTMDLHAPQIQGFFDIPLDHLYSSTIFCEYFRRKKIPDLVVMAPDVGGIRMARAYAKRLEAPLAVVDKRRPTANQAKAVNVIGEVEDRNVLIVDDLIDTGGTLVEAVHAIKKKGARKIYAACTHAILSGTAAARIQECEDLEELAVTDTVFIPDEKRVPKLRVLTVAQLFAEAIRRIHNNESISILFD
ncbi:MAG: ribose-phosphate pyrophosphokinase [candidate division KSB1 bacterium]|nr:ribose-phosphate pyrophosphokinase [candidate division KSB1 bacterium]